MKFLNQIIEIIF